MGFSTSSFDSGSLDCDTIVEIASSSYDFADSTDASGSSCVDSTLIVVLEALTDRFRRLGLEGRGPRQ